MTDDGTIHDRTFQGRPGYSLWTVSVTDQHDESYYFHVFARNAMQAKEIAGRLITRDMPIPEECKIRDAFQRDTTGFPI